MGRLTVWQATRPLGRGRRLSGAELWRSLLVHWRAGAAVLLLACGIAAILGYAERPDSIAVIRITAASRTDQPALAALAGMLRQPATRLDALYAVGLSRVFPDLLPGEAGAHSLALARLDLAQRVDYAAGDGALAVTTRLAEPRIAAALDRELVQSALDGLAPSPPVGVAPLFRPEERLDALRAEQARLQTALDAADRQAVTLSARMTDLARDMVASLRVADPRPPTDDVLDQARKLLAEMQLKRVELSSKYTDDFPAIAATDAEIAKLQGFVAAQEHRATPRPPAANPAFATLGAERARVGGELQALQAQRADAQARLQALQPRIDALERRPAPTALPAAALPPERFVVEGVTLATAADPRPALLGAVLLAGLLLAALVPIVLLRFRRVFATPAEVEAALGLPVLRCLDRDGLPVGPVAIPAAARSALAVLPIRLLPEDRP